MNRGLLFGAIISFIFFVVCSIYLPDLGAMIDTHYHTTTADFYLDHFLRGDLDFEFSEMNVNSSFTSDKVIVDVNYPVTVINDETRTVISKYNAEFPARLGHILDIKDAILSNLLNTGRVGFDILGSFDVELNVIPYSKDTLVYSIYDQFLFVFL